MTEPNMVPVSKSSSFFQSLRAPENSMTSAPSKWNVLVYGPLNTGKTTFLTTFPRPIVIASFEPNGASSIRHQLAASDGQIIVVNRTERDSGTTPTAYLNLLNLMKAFANGPDKEIGTFCIDGFTLLAEAILTAVCVEKNHETPSQPDYLVQLNRVKALIKLGLNLTCNFAVTAHESIYSDPNLGIFTRSILASPSIQAWLPSVFDEVYYANRSKQEYKLVTRSNGEVIARSRLGAGNVFDNVENPDFMALLTKANATQQHKANV